MKFDLQKVERIFKKLKLFASTTTILPGLLRGIKKSDNIMVHPKMTSQPLGRGIKDFVTTVAQP